MLYVNGYDIEVFFKRDSCLPHRTGVIDVGSVSLVQSADEAGRTSGKEQPATGDPFLGPPLAQDTLSQFRWP